MNNKWPRGRIYESIHTSIIGSKRPLYCFAITVYLWPTIALWGQLKMLDHAVVQDYTTVVFRLCAAATKSETMIERAISKITH